MRNYGQTSAARTVCCCLVAIVLLISGGCSSLKVVETWHKPALQGHAYKKILILGVARDNNRRQIFEDIVVAELRRHQVDAVPGNTIIPEMNPDKYVRAEVVAAVRASGCDAVLTTRALAVGGNNVAQAGQSFVYGADNMSAHYDFLKATLQSNLFDAATEELVWSSTVSTFDADQATRVSRDLGLFFFESLRRDGFI